MSIYLTGGTIVTGDPQKRILRDATLKISGNRIVSVHGPGELRDSPGADDEVVGLGGMAVIPGFVQTHIHLCQTLFRGLADDLPLLEWLRRRIFPLEASHTERSMELSARIGIAELIRSGTTTILDMGSVNHEEQIIRAVGESGLRAFVGKALMDVNDAYPGLRESTAGALASTRKLIDAWHMSYDGRIRCAVEPRFVLSCSDGLMHGAREMVDGTKGALFHTHASESTSEIAEVRKRFGKDNIEVLHSFNVLSSHACLAHCVHLNAGERRLLRETGTSVAHCPSSNLKLGSGVAQIPALMSEGINVSLGADGAPCNNTLDMFQEMRLAALLQKPAVGPEAMPAEAVFDIATMGGARALGLDRDIGSIEPGKLADLAILKLDEVWNPLSGDVYSSIVYSSGPENVRSVMIDGKWVYRNREFASIDLPALVLSAAKELALLLSRAPVS